MSGIPTVEPFTLMTSAAEGQAKKVVDLASQIGVGIAGLGDVADSHYKGLVASPHAQLVGVYCRTEQTRTARAKQWGVKAYGSYGEMLADNDVKAVLVLAADDAHYDLTMSALKAGKHVLVEKPPSRKIDEVVRMDALSKQLGLTCMPVHNYVYLPRIKQAKEVIDSGRIGDVSYAFFIVTLKMPEELTARSYHGALITQCWHLIYVSNFLLGLPVRIQALQNRFKYTIDQDDLVVMNFEYANRGIGTIVGNWTANDTSSHPWAWTYKMIATNGGINYSGYDAVTYAQNLTAGGWRSSEWIEYEDSFVYTVKYFIEDVLCEGKQPLSTMADAIITLDIIDNVEKAAETGRTIDYKPIKTALDAKQV